MMRCPFCGNLPLGEKDVRLDPVKLNMDVVKEMGYGIKCDPYKIYYVICLKCGSKGGIGSTVVTKWNGKCFGPYSLTEEEAQEIAVKKWNTRA